MIVNITHEPVEVWIVVCRKDAAYGAPPIVNLNLDSLSSGYEDKECIHSNNIERCLAGLVYFAPARYAVREPQSMHV